MITVAPKTLTKQIKPVCAEVRKQTTPSKRYQAPILGAVRIQHYRDQWKVAPLFESPATMGTYPNPNAPLDVILDLDNAYALATILDPKRPATLAVEPWEAEYTECRWGGNHVPVKCTGVTLTVSQPSASRHHADVMRFKTLEVQP